MAYPIDVVFCDRDWVVRHVVRRMRPDRISKVVFASRHVLELAAGAAASLREGDQLSVTWR
jgi:uncharacterized membrane protein (UPF0127 family)